MHAIRVHEFGGPEVLRVEDVPEPAPGEGEALVRLRAIGVNFIDAYHRTGLYPNPLPFPIGVEGAGTVEATGAGVLDLRPGDRVGWAGVPGSYAELAAVPADRLVPLPPEIRFEDAAAALLQGMTAHYLAHGTAPLGPGHACLVHAAAGGVGLLLCQIARRRGARVIGVVSTEEKAALAREAGAHEVIVTAERDFEAEARRLTGGVGVDVAYDSVGKDTWERSLRSLARRGMLVLYGNASGPVPPIDPLLLSRYGSLFVTRPALGDYTATREELSRRAGDVLASVAAGTLKLRIHATFPLAEAAEAHRALEARKTAGKLLLIP